MTCFTQPIRKITTNHEESEDQRRILNFLNFRRRKLDAQLRKEGKIHHFYPSYLLTMNVIDRSLKELEHETTIFTKLIHRNFNQHRKTKVFSSLHQVHKLMKTLLSINLRHMGTETEHKLRLLQNVTKIASRDFTNCLQHTTYMHQILLLGTDISVWLRRSAVLLHAQLTQLVFVPLYTMFVALVARCLRSLSALLFQWEVQLLSLQSSLRHVMTGNTTYNNPTLTSANTLSLSLSLSHTVNQRHRTAATELILSGCTLASSNPQVHLQLQELRTVYSHHHTTTTATATATTTTTVPNTVAEDATTEETSKLCDTNIRSSGSGINGGNSITTGRGMLVEQGGHVPMKTAHGIACDDDDDDDDDDDSGDDDDDDDDAQSGSHIDRTKCSSNAPTGLHRHQYQGQGHEDMMGEEDFGEVVGVGVGVGVEVESSVITGVEIELLSELPSPPMPQSRPQSQQSEIQSQYEPPPVPLPRKNKPMDSKPTKQSSMLTGKSISSSSSSSHSKKGGSSSGSGDKISKISTKKRNRDSSDTATGDGNMSGGTAGSSNKKKKKKKSTDEIDEIFGDLW